MTIDQERRGEILRLYKNENLAIETVARTVGVHHSVVRRVVKEVSNADKEQRSKDGNKKPCKVDPYRDFLASRLIEIPQITASRLYLQIKARGYTGGITQLREAVAQLRGNRPKEAFLRLVAISGEEAQVDWAHCGTFTCGNTERPLYAFVIVLSYSRAVYVQFFLGLSMEFFLAGHAGAFNWLGGVPRRCLYDNLKSVVIERSAGAIRVNQVFMRFANEYRFEPRPVGVARGNEKGRVERAIQYLRSDFLRGRVLPRSLSELNGAVLAWSEGPALERKWQNDLTKTVREKFEEERKLLLPLPSTPVQTMSHRTASVGKTPYVRFDNNDYSVPHKFVLTSVSVFSSPDSIFIEHGGERLARHTRSYEKGKTIEDPEHLKALRTEKHQAQTPSLMASLLADIPRIETLLATAQELDVPLDRLIKSLVSFRHLYGVPLLTQVVETAIQERAVHPKALKHQCEKAHAASGALPLRQAAMVLPTAAQALPPIATHRLEAYDIALTKPHTTED